MDWDGVQYIFQIPLDWYKGVHNWIENSYGTDFLTVSEGYYGGQRIGIDKDLFVDAVNDAVLSSGLSGYVKTVNNIKPDQDGNVDLDDNFLETTDIASPGLTVGLDYDDDDHPVCNPNHAHNVTDVDGAVRTVNGQGPDENGNVEVEVEGGVKTVDGVEPDEDGNIELGAVREVNGHTPDEDGKIEFSVVETVDGVSPVDGNVPLGAVRSIDSNIFPTNGNVDLTGKYSQIGHTHQHTDITDWSTATDSFLESDDITSPGTTVGLDYSGDYTVCSPNHGHKASDITDADDNWVTLDTQQTITGSKTFQDDVVVEGATGGLVAVYTQGGITMQGEEPAINLVTASRTGDIKIVNGELKIGTGSGLTESTIRMGGSGMTISQFGANVKLQLEAGQNLSQLANSPSKDNAPDLAIATCGWVKDKAVTVPDGKTAQTRDVTIVTGVTWNGTQIVVARQKLEFTNGLLTNVTSQSNTTIDTLAYSPS